MKALTIFLILLIATSCKNDVRKISIKDDISALASDQYEGRETGTAGERAAAKYISERFKALGLEPKGTDGYFQTFNFTSTAHAADSLTTYTYSKNDSLKGTNVLGYLDNNASQTVIIGAHYDHLGYGGDASLYHGGEKKIHLGADDNASGVAVLLNLVAKLKDVNFNNNYLFMAFSGEEMGLLGSNYFIQTPTINLSTANYMINMDMVGRLKPDSTLAVYGTGTSPIFKKVLHQANKGFNLIERESGVGPSDHTSFYLNDIPVLHFFTGQHKDYHKPSDRPEKLNYDGMELIADYILDVITQLNDKGKLAFTKNKHKTPESDSFKVGMGVMPDYLFEGKGMRIEGTRDNAPASLAGLEKGDIVVQLGDSSVTDIYSYMRALSVFEKGDKTQVTVKREGQKIKSDLQF